MSTNASHISVLIPGRTDLRISRFSVSTGSPQLEWTKRVSTGVAELRAFVRAENLGGDAFVLVLPRHDITVRILDFPSTNATELSKMVRFAVAEHVPYPVEEIVPAYRVLSSTAGKSRVLAAFARKDEMRDHVASMKEAGIALADITFSTSCLVESLNETSHDDAEAIVVWSDEGVEFLALENDALCYGRAARIAADVEPSAVAEEIQRSVSALSQEFSDHAPITQVRVESQRDSGDDFGLELEALLRSNGVESVSIEHESVVAVGAARQYVSGVGISLLPPEVVAVRSQDFFKRRLSRVAIFLVVSAVSAGCVLVQSIAQRTAYLTELEGRVAELEPRVADVATMREHLRRLQSELTSDGTPLELLAGVTRHAPSEGINITRYEYRRGAGITLQGSSLEYRTFERLLDDLRQAGETTMPQFARAQEVYRTLRRERNQEVWSYSITMPFDHLRDAPDE